MRSGACGDASAPGARTIERALRVLDSFTVAERRWRTTALAHHCGLPVPTTHRILRMLERFGYVLRDPSGAYGLGPAAANFARGDPQFAELRAFALPALRAAHHATGERASLSALSQSRDHCWEVCVVDADESDARLRSEASTTQIAPLHAGASCKALLSRLGNEELARAIGRGLDPFGPATIRRPARLRREVAAIRRRGWAFSREETAAETWAVAVPVAGPERAPECAVAISAPLTRCDAERARRHVSVLAGAARLLSTRLRDELQEPPMVAERAA